MIKNSEFSHYQKIVEKFGKRKHSYLLKLQQKPNPSQPTFSEGKPIDHQDSKMLETKKLSKINVGSLIPFNRNLSQHDLTLTTLPLGKPQQKFNKTLKTPFFAPPFQLKTKQNWFTTETITKKEEQGNSCRFSQNRMKNLEERYQANEDEDRTQYLKPIINQQFEQKQKFIKQKINTQIQSTTKKKRRIINLHKLDSINRNSNQLVDLMSQF